MWKHQGSVPSPFGTQAVACDSDASTRNLLDQPLILENDLVSVSMATQPITPGHVTMVCNRPGPISALSLADFIEVLNGCRRLSIALNTTMETKRCGLVCEDKIISLIPMHEQSKKQQELAYEPAEFYGEYPGFLTSKDGPEMSVKVLDDARDRITAITWFRCSNNDNIYGKTTHYHSFARMVHGEEVYWPVWEDDYHVAFLKPTGNTLGLTVLVPRKQLDGDVFRLQDSDYKKLVTAAHKMAGHLKKAFGVRRCGMIIEGFEDDNHCRSAHVQLIPVHDDEKQYDPILGAMAVEARQRHLTTQFRSSASNIGKLGRQAAQVKKLLQPEPILKAPKSWENPSTFSMNEIRSSWYSAMSKIQSSLFHASVCFFQKSDYRYIIVPQTTNSISSPMGLGSDSVPVHVNLHGDDTYLADSMQFALERALRLDNETQGAYYVGTSFRGEDPDAMHLNQFYHVECELQGKLDDGIRIAEQYVVYIATQLLKQHEDIIMRIAGTTSHIVTMLEKYSATGRAFPRITLDDALGMPEIRGSVKAWTYVTPNEHRNGRALTRLGEHILMRRLGGVVWLTEMDHLSVPFYQAFLPNSGNTKAICADLLLGPGEVLGLGQRHVMAEEVVEALRMHKVEEGTSYAWYLEMRKPEEARMQTTGWGMGMERFLAWVLQHDDIRDLQVFSRLKGAMGRV